MDRSAAEALFQEANAFRSVRPPTWQGPLARSGPAHDAPAPKASAPVEQKAASVPVAPHSQSLWHILEAAAGGGQKGKLVSRLMQKQLLARVDSLPIDEIELLAGGVPLGKTAR